MTDPPWPGFYCGFETVTGRIGHSDAPAVVVVVGGCSFWWCHFKANFDDRASPHTSHVKTSNLRSSVSTLLV